MIEAPATRRAHEGYRYLAAAIGALAVLASLLVGLARRPPSPS
jgi:hypothetical protein